MIFRAVKPHSVICHKVYRCHMQFVQTHTMYTTNNEPPWKQWTVADDTSVLSINSNNSTTLAKDDDDNWRSYRCGNNGIHSISVLSLCFYEVKNSPEVVYLKRHTVT